VVQGIPVRLYVTRLHREHINSFSIEPFVRSTAFFPPGTIGVIEFTPDRTGEFVMLNEGHGYRAALSVASSIGEASARSTSTGVQEFALVHDFSGGRLAPQRLVVQRGVPVRIYNTGLGGEDKVSISPFYLPTAANVMQGRITTFEFTPTMAGEFPISYEKGKLSGTLVVEDKR
jgi:plastocyanin domain-containing protein